MPPLSPRHVHRNILIHPQRAVGGVPAQHVLARLIEGNLHGPLAVGRGRRRNPARSPLRIGARARILPRFHLRRQDSDFRLVIRFKMHRCTVQQTRNP